MKLRNQKDKIENYEYFFYIFLGVAAFFLNFWASNRGVFPIDTFLHYDSANRILNGEKPVKDFWIIHGITLDYIQSIFFYFFGTNWISYISHSSLLNSIVTIFFFKFLREIDLNIFISSFLTICFLILAYPVSGVPFIDHHATFFSFIAILIFFTCTINKKYKNLLIIPTLFGLAFFSKPVPTIYILTFFSLISFSYFFYTKNLKSFFLLIYGAIAFFLLIMIFLLLQKISIYQFLEQLILYPSSIGGSRMSAIMEAISVRIFNYKFIFILIIYLLSIFLFKKNYKKFSTENFFLFFMIISFSLVMIAHQIMTNNQNFIFFLIPINIGLILFLNEKILKGYKIFINTFFLVLCLVLTIKYFDRFLEKRKFHELVNVNFENAINSVEIDKTLYPLKWVTPAYRNPYEELNLIKNLVQRIESSDKNIALITNYNFLNSITKKKTFSIVKNFDQVTIPLEDNKYNENFKIFFLKQIKKKEIEEIILFLPESKNVNEVAKNFKKLISLKCLSYKEINTKTVIYAVKDC